MRIGSYKINNISKRFWVLAVLLLVLPIIVFISLPGDEPEPFLLNPKKDDLRSFFSDPRSSLETLARSGKDYKWYPIGEKDQTIAPGNDWDPVQYQNDTIETRIFVPNSRQLDAIAKARPSLVYTRDGINYYPVFVILPERAITEENRVDWVSAFVGGEELTPVLQIASTEVLPPGEYDIRGLLYARSNLLNKQTPAEEDNASFTSWVPTVLLAEKVPVSPAEGEKPASGRAEINIPVRVGNYELILKSIEWAPPEEIRLCVGASNISRFARIAPPDLEGNNRFYLTVNGRKYSLTLRDQERSPFASLNPTLDRGAEPIFTYFSYVDSGTPLPAEIEEIAISFPVFGAPIPISNVTVSGSDLKEPEVSDRYRYGGCQV
jgi:hypothetical protein